jgi:hypothetical protein
MLSPVREKRCVSRREIRSGPGSNRMGALPLMFPRVGWHPHRLPAWHLTLVQRTVYFDPRLSTSSLGLALKSFVPGPNGLPLWVWERTAHRAHNRTRLRRSM